jgi:hypothetical protein
MGTKQQWILGVIVIILGVASAIYGLGASAAKRPLTPSPVAQNDSNPAINNPDKFAWELFVALNRPAGNGTRDTVWETWASDEDVYGDPNRTPLWPGAAGPTPKGVQPKRLRPITQLQILREEEQRRGRRRGRQQPAPKFIPGQQGGEEVRMNKATFDFIVANNLWYVEGQELAFEKGQKIDLPLDSKEIKAVWQEITEAQKPRFHWQFDPTDGKTYGLVALHIISKDLPNWTWATFEQVDNPERCKVAPCLDSFGVTPGGAPSEALLEMFKAGGLGGEWLYYRLDDTQTDFTDSTGVPTLVGNSIIENGFVTTSSCITCHARASIGPRVPGQARANRLSVFAPNGESHNGTPQPGWYFTNSGGTQKRKYLQLDFLWSMFRAKRRTT